MRRDETRVVPGHDLAANLIGFTGGDMQGLGGLEASYDDVLRGVDGKRTFEIGQPDGPVDLDQEIPGGYHSETPARPGSSLVLTIDRDLQFEIQRILGVRMAQVKADVGAAVVLDVRTGEVLAQASYPFFDAANPFASKPADRGDVATGYVVEPGSVHKGVVFAACLQEGVVTPADSIAGADHASRRASPRSRTPTAQVADADPARRSWPGRPTSARIELADKLGADKLYEYQRAFGLGEQDRRGAAGRVGRAGAAAGELERRQLRLDPDRARRLGHAAADGRRLRHHRQRRGVGAAAPGQGDRRARTARARPAAPAPTRQVISAQNAADLRTMLEAVVTAPAPPGVRPRSRTTGSPARPAPARVIANGKPVPGEVGSFVGMAPADAPRYVIAVFTHTAGRGGRRGGGAGVRRHDGLHAAALRGRADRYQAADVHAFP